MTLLLALACAHRSPEPPVVAFVPSEHAVHAPAVGAPARWTGTWGDDGAIGGSSAVYRFALHDGELWMDAWDSGDGEWFVLEGLAYDNGVTVTTIMPSTNWTLDQRFELAGGVLIQRYTGSAEGEDRLVPVDVAPPR